MGLFDKLRARKKRLEAAAKAVSDESKGKARAKAKKKVIKRKPKPKVKVEAKKAVERPKTYGPETDLFTTLEGLTAAQAKSYGYTKVKGFTRADGTKVKTHYRKK